MTTATDKIQSDRYLSLSPGAERETGPAPLFPIPADVEAGAICWKSFAAFEATMPIDEFRDFLASYLLDVELHLEQIARSRTRRDFASIAWEARYMAIQASAFGALRVRAAAGRLERACNIGALDVTYRLLSELSRSCEEAGKQLHNWLHSPAEIP